jgi:hypothetical protein
MVQYISAKKNRRRRPKSLKKVSTLEAMSSSPAHLIQGAGQTNYSKVILRKDGQVTPHNFNRETY